MIKFLQFSIILLIFFVYVRVGFCQTVNSAQNPANSKNFTCPLVKITPESRFASTLMFYMGNLIIIVICAGVIVFALSLFPKRIVTCPVAKLAEGKKIELLYGDRRIAVSAGSSEFKTIISNLTDERQQPDFQISSIKMYIYVQNRRYAAQISMSGWNFINEDRNSRRLVNNMQVVKTIDALIYRSPGSKV